MSQKIQALRRTQDDHAHVSPPQGPQPAYPVLPDSMQRGALEGLLLDVSKHIGLSDSLLKSLLAMLRETRPSDWTDPTRAPICFTMQNNIASVLGKSERAVRNDEAALVALGFVDKQVAGNGSRCRLVFADGSEFRQGLCFSPLIDAVPDLIAIRAQMRFERQHRTRLKRQCSALKRNVKITLMRLQPLHPEHAGLKAIAESFLNWPTRYASLRSMEAMEAHYEEVLITSEAIDEISQLLPNTSGPAEPHFRRYIQDTTQDNSVICNNPVDKRTDCTQSDDNLTDTEPNGPVNCLENKHGAADVAVNSEFITKLNPNRLFALSSKEMRLYIRQHQGQRHAPSAMDFILASIDRLPELGINRSAYDAALAQMGDMATALAILIIDRNRFHPDTPIKNPGGVLRAMTARHKAGKLNLVGSLIGLTERMKA